MKKIPLPNLLPFPHPSMHIVVPETVDLDEGILDFASVFEGVPVITEICMNNCKKSQKKYINMVKLINFS